MRQYLDAKQQYRDAVRAEVARFAEIFITAPPEVREQRDPKGLYAKARTGKVKNLPGFDASFDAPPSAELVLDGTRDSAALAKQVMDYLTMHLSA